MLSSDLAHHNFAAAFNAVSDTDVVAVFDHGEETRAEFASFWRDVWGEVPAYGDYERMLSEVKPDLVCIATRQTMHADQIEAAVASGVRGILCDKPLATSLGEMERIIAACAEVPLAFGLDRRWSEPHLHIRKNMEAWVGTITGAITLGLNNTINHGCHVYDALLGLLGDPEPVWVSGLLDDSPSDNARPSLDPSSRAQVGFDNGLVAHITMDGGKGYHFDILGDKGRLSVRTDGQEVYLWRADANGIETLKVPVKTSRWPEGPEIVSDLADSVRNGGRTACDIEQARRATSIGFAIHHSSNNGGARVDIADVDRSLRVPSNPWGNEPPA